VLILSTLTQNMLLHKEFKKYLKSGQIPTNKEALEQQQHYQTCTDYNCDLCTYSRIIELGLSKTFMAREFYLNRDNLERAINLQLDIINKIESSTNPSVQTLSEFRIIYHGTIVSKTRFDQVCKQIYELKFPPPKLPEPEIKQLYYCPICFEHVSFDTLCALQCGHIHCKPCTHKFMNKSEQICPMCRTEIVMVTPLLFTNL